MSESITRRLTIAPEEISSLAAKRALAEAAQILRNGGTVAFPTETVYGLGANALAAEAVSRIFLAKQRPAWDPLIVHVSDIAMLGRVAASVSARAQKLIDAFWPGPLTLLLPRSESVPDAITAGRALVGVRLPAHAVARALIAAAGVPIAAPSANRFGHTSPTNAQHVLDDLDGRIDMVLDGGPTSFGVESTVVEAREDSVILYRPGAVSAEEIAEAAGPVMLYRPPEGDKGAIPESLPSPGSSIRHYAPNARLVLMQVGAGPNPYAQWLDFVAKYAEDALRLGVMQPAGWPMPEHFAGIRYDWGNWEDVRELARRLFAGLRALDASGVETILCPVPADSGMGAAIADRLRKAARKH